MLIIKNEHKIFFYIQNTYTCYLFLNNTLSKNFQITKKNVHEFNFFSDCNYIQDLVRSLKIYMYNVGQER